MEEMMINRAEMSDAQEIFALYRSLIQMPYSTWDEDYPSLESVEEDLAHNEVLVMRDARGKIVAAIAITNDDEEFDCDTKWYPDVTHWKSLSRLGVAQEMQGKGIAKKMLVVAMDVCAQRGAQAVRFLVSKTNPYPQRAYAKLNFDICGGNFLLRSTLALLSKEAQILPIRSIHDIIKYEFMPLEGSILMHMRTKKWAKPELAVCLYFQEDATAPRGKWRALFKKDQPLHLELGCGKGVSTAAMVYDNQDVNYIAMDITCNVLGDTRRNIAATFGEEPIDNVIITRHDIEFIRQVFAPEDRIERIYINFCNPWTKRPKYAKRRLTHPRQLMQYRDFLIDGGEIWFKTDDMPLFEDSLPYFEACGFEMRYMTKDLHADGFAPNYISEHEKMYTEQGIPIKFVIMRKKPGTIDLDPVRFVMPGAFAKLRGDEQEAETSEEIE